MAVTECNEGRPVVDWIQPQTRPGSIQRSCRRLSRPVELGLQFSELTEFIGALLPTTRTAVVYATQGNVEVLQDFSADHKLAIKGMRLPLREANGSSIYLSRPPC